MFLSSILLGNGMFSNQVIGQENEVEVNADIEQENKCKKDSECEIENQINANLNLINNTTILQQQDEPVIPTCETCYTDNLTPDQIAKYEEALNSSTKGEISTIQEACNEADQRSADRDFPEVISQGIFGLGKQAGIDTDTLNTIADCFEEVYGITIPRP